MYERCGYNHVNEAFFENQVFSIWYFLILLDASMPIWIIFLEKSVRHLLSIKGFNFNLGKVFHISLCIL